MNGFILGVVSAGRCVAKAPELRSACSLPAAISAQIGGAHPLDLFALFQRPQAFAQEVGHEFIARA